MAERSKLRYPGTMKPFTVVLKEGHPFGLLVGVSLPGSPDPVPPEVLDRLHPAEREAALSLRGYRQPEWVAGRLAANAAVRLLGLRPQPVLSDARGAPLPPEGARVSISHKRTLAVALAARLENGDIGVDLEDVEPARAQVAPKVLTPRELAEVESLPEQRRWTAVLLRFSLKEALYKAIAPRLQRAIGFEEAEVDPHPDGGADLRLLFAEPDAPRHLEGRYHWMNGRVLAMVRARWA